MCDKVEALLPQTLARNAVAFNGGGGTSQNAVRCALPCLAPLPSFHQPSALCRGTPRSLQGAARRAATRARVPVAPCGPLRTAAGAPPALGQAPRPTLQALLGTLRA